MPRTGRPRRDGRASSGDPTDEILRVAAHLFQDLGVDGTTMARIASEAGLGQSSLYYYFQSKEAVVAELVARANVVPLELVDRLDAWDGSAAAKLLLFVQGDVEALCGLAFDINEVHRVAARDRERFAGYWSERRRLEKRLAALIRKGIADGDFREVDPTLTALLLMSTDEGVQNWYRLGTARKPDVVGRAAAELCVGGLLSGRRSLGDVTHEAAQLQV